MQPAGATGSPMLRPGVSVQQVKTTTGEQNASSLNNILCIKTISLKYRDYSKGFTVPEETSLPSRWKKQDKTDFFYLLKVITTLLGYVNVSTIVLIRDIAIFLSSC
jgi:hypothetical protein